jgi:hypothetical protein
MYDTCLIFLAWCEYYVHHLPLVTEQVPHIRQLLPSLITLNAKGLLTPVQPVHGATSNWETCRINQQLTDCIARSLDGCLSAPGKECSVTALYIQDNDKKRKETNSRFALSEKLQFTKVIIDPIFQILKPQPYHYKGRIFNYLYRLYYIKTFPSLHTVFIIFYIILHHLHI